MKIPLQILIFVLCLPVMSGQTIHTGLGWHHIGTAKMGGLGLEVACSKLIKGKWNIGIRNQITHASGFRSFNYNLDANYLLGDPYNRQTFYDPGGGPSLYIKTEELIATFKLAPDRTTQVSYGLLFGYQIPTGTGAFQIQWSPALVTVHKKYIIDTDNGTFTNLFDTFDDINIVYVFINDYVDISMSVDLVYRFSEVKKIRPAINIRLEHLFSGYWNYGMGLQILFGH